MNPREPEMATRVYGWQTSPIIDRMNAITAEQARLILTTVGLPSLKAEHPVTERVIAAIPPDKADYRPDTVVRSAIDLAWHIVTAENRFLESVINGAFD